MFREVTVNNLTVLKAFTCTTSVYQTYQCSTKVPGAAGSESIWVETSIANKILVKQNARTVGSVVKAVHTPAVSGGADASDSTATLTKIGNFLYAYPQIRYSEYAPVKDTTYKDF